MRQMGEFRAVFTAVAGTRGGVAATLAAHHTPGKTGGRDALSTRTLAVTMRCD